MEIEKPSRRRRNHTEEFKQAVITACCEAGASVAAQQTGYGSEIRYDGTPTLHALCSRECRLDPNCAYARSPRSEYVRV